MIGNSQACYLCDSEDGVKGCVCGGIFKLIGNKCLNYHINDGNKDHNLLELDLASTIQADSPLFQSYLDELPKIYEAIQFLVGSSEEIKKSKSLIKQAKYRIISHIEQIFSTFEEKIEKTDEEIHSHIKCLHKYRSSLDGEGRILMEKYKSQALLDNTATKIDIPVDQILQYLTYALHIDQPTSTEYSSALADSAQKDCITDPLKSDLVDKDKNIYSYSDIRKTLIQELECEEATEELRHHSEESQSLSSLKEPDGPKSHETNPSFQQEYNATTNLFTLIGHKDSVASVCVTPDGRWIVSGSEDDTVRIWNMVTRTQEAVLRGHTASVHSLCVSSDGRWIVSGGGDDTVRIWKMLSRSQEVILNGHTGSVNSVCISADDRWIISASADYSIRVWSMVARSQEAVLDGHTGCVNSVCISLNSKWVVSGSWDNTVRVWNMHTKTQEAVLTGHIGTVLSVYISADSRWIVSGSADATVRLWNRKNKSQEAVLVGHAHYVWSVCISADSRWILSGSADNTIRVWNMLTRSQQAVLAGHINAVLSVCVSVDGRWIVSGGGDGTVRIWN